jgi:hypothetical protein
MGSFFFSSFLSDLVFFLSLVSSSKVLINYALRSTSPSFSELSEFLV